MSYRYSSDPDPRAIKLGIIAILVVALAVATIWLVPVSFDKVPRDKVGLAYGGGPIEGADYQGLLPPGTGLRWVGILDKVYEYPVTERTYLISKNPEVGDRQREDFIRVPSADSVPIDFEAGVYFTINTAEDVLRGFHERIGLKREAWTDPGWTAMLEEYFRPQIEAAFQREARRFTVADLYANPDTLREIQARVERGLKGNVADALGADYFCGPGFAEGGACGQFRFIIFAITPPNNVVQGFEANRTSQIDIQTRRNNAEAARVEAEAAVDRRRLEAQAVRELQAALASAPDYVRLRAVEQGDVTFWVLPENTNVTVPGPR